MNKILVFGGLAVLAILLIENMVMPYAAYVLWFTSKSYILTIFSAIIGFFIGYGVKGFSSESNNDDGEMDF